MKEEIARLKELSDEMGEITTKLILSDLRTYHERNTKIPVERLGLSDRVISRLLNWGIGYIEDLVKLSTHELKRIRGLGEVGITEIRAKLSEHGLD